MVYNYHPVLLSNLWKSNPVFLAEYNPVYGVYNCFKDGEFAGYNVVSEMKKKH